MGLQVRTKFASVLAYFGEEPTMASHDFFSTLSKFVQVTTAGYRSRSPSQEPPIDICAPQELMIAIIKLLLLADDCENEITFARACMASF